MSDQPKPIFDAPLHYVPTPFPDDGAHGGYIIRDVPVDHPDVIPSRVVARDAGPGTVIAVREAQPSTCMPSGWIGPWYLFRPDAESGAVRGRDVLLSGNMLKPEVLSVPTVFPVL